MKWDRADPIAAATPTLSALFRADKIASLFILGPFVYRYSNIVTVISAAKSGVLAKPIFIEVSRKLPKFG